MISRTIDGNDECGRPRYLRTRIVHVTIITLFGIFSRVADAQVLRLSADTDALRLAGGGPLTAQTALHQVRRWHAADALNVSGAKAPLAGVVRTRYGIWRAGVDFDAKTGFFELANAPLRASAHGLVNAHLDLAQSTVKSTRGTLHLMLFVHNLTDRNYRPYNTNSAGMIDMSNPSVPPISTVGLLGQKRQIGLMLGYRF